MTIQLTTIQKDKIKQLENHLIQNNQDNILEESKIIEDFSKSINKRGMALSIAIYFFVGLKRKFMNLINDKTLFKLLTTGCLCLTTLISFQNVIGFKSDYHVLSNIFQPLFYLGATNEKNLNLEKYDLYSKFDIEKPIQQIMAYSDKNHGTNFTATNSTNHKSIWRVPSDTNYHHNSFSFKIAVQDLQSQNNIKNDNIYFDEKLKTLYIPKHLFINHDSKINKNVIHDIIGFDLEKMFEKKFPNLQITVIPNWKNQPENKSSPKNYNESDIHVYDAQISAVIVNNNDKQ